MAGHGIALEGGERVPTMTRERLQKVLAAAGIASRRGAEAMIARGEVTVNGLTAAIGQTVDPSVDKISVDDTPLHRPTNRLYLALNKPAGVVSSLRSTHGEPTVRQLIDRPERVFPVGRLDKETTGLLLLTDDGEWANLVMHPRFGIEKQYVLVVRGHPAPETVNRLRRGVTLPSGEVTAPAGVDVLSSSTGTTTLSVTVIEGKRRQIRLMAEAIGHPALQLERVSVGGIQLDDLPRAAWRELTEAEVEGIRQSARAQSRGSV